VSEGASESAVEKSSYEVISDKPPDVDTVKDEPDILRGFTASNVFESPSMGAPAVLRSRIGIASSVVYACPIISESNADISRLGSHGFCAHVSGRKVSPSMAPCRSRYSLLSMLVAG
jgi:hypothetical protein